MYGNLIFARIKSTGGEFLIPHENLKWLKVLISLNVKEHLRSTIQPLRQGKKADCDLMGKIFFKDFLNLKQREPVEVVRL